MQSIIFYKKLTNVYNFWSKTSDKCLVGIKYFPKKGQNIFQKKRSK
jgi:hypothetical protein